MKTTVGVLMGGYSPEFEISILSGQTVYEHLDRKLFEPYAVHILRDRWVVVENGEEFPIDKNDFSCVMNGRKITFDVLFNAIHGSPGEDGLLQGYLEMLGIPHTSSGQFEAALTFNKAECNQVLKDYGVRCAPSIFLHPGETVSGEEVAEKLGFPVFIKPNRAGSSFGVSRVDYAGQVADAIAFARVEDDRVVIEKGITGTEAGCGVFSRNGQAEVIAITEIVPKNQFFDYEAKYHGASEEITPARFDAGLYQEIGEISQLAFRVLHLQGIVRVDFIVDKDSGKPYLIEVNTVPGLSAASIVPQQITYSGHSLTNFFTLVVNEALRQ